MLLVVWARRLVREYRVRILFALFANRVGRETIDWLDEVIVQGAHSCPPPLVNFPLKTCHPERRTSRARAVRANRGTCFLAATPRVPHPSAFFAEGGDFDFLLTEIS
jgi:hypothetical protein